MTPFTVELESDSPGFVTGRLIEEGAGIVFSVTVVSDSTRGSQKRVVALLADQINWFIDLSHGGKR
jgi:hypothetical protein